MILPAPVGQPTCLTAWTGRRQPTCLPSWTTSLGLRWTQPPAARTTSVQNTTQPRIAPSIMSGGGETVFCNPPYGKAIAEWVRKCSMEASRKDTTVVMLIPSRTDTRWWHRYILNRAEVRFLPGRLRFETDGKPGCPAPFPSEIVVMRTGER